MKLFHKFQKNNVDTSAVERERQELRKRMNKAEKNMSDRQETKKPKKAAYGQRYPSWRLC